MTKGKYKARAANREVARDNELIVEKVEEIESLKQQLAESQQDAHLLRTQMNSEALRIASEMSLKDKQKLRAEIEELKYQRVEEKMRHAVLVWEIMHRRQFNRPAPISLTLSEANIEQKESYDYWNSVSWEIGSLFFSDWESVNRFRYLCQGWEMQMAGTISGGARSGSPTLKRTARESTRQLRKGNIKGMMVKRVRELHAHFDRIYTGRMAGRNEPVVSFRDVGADGKAPEDRREDLVIDFVEKLQEMSGSG